jgi:YkoP domain
LSVELSDKRGLRAIHPEQWVFGLDRWLRRWHGVYEFSGRRECLFRAERCLAEESLLLCDGVRVRRGDPLLRVHLWNEHMPAMGQKGPTLAWARRASRAIETSLRELARHLMQCSELDEVVAVCADMRLATAKQSAQLVRIVSRYGFEAAKDSRVGRPGLLRFIGENILMVLLILATNPTAFRAEVLRRGHARVIISRAKLLRLYRP